ncbi:hypothetical protein H310_12768 [Aphanomyces invadans]|uniref:VWFA domain-containing protein n=1 Tax=Aphanomyces invadans TaxID=157072 RepID=A0A024TGM1_9STRA|nr:hypothetical protein H310_12768 [Aphanomyces invadans]ETV93159.1 hypothetical protein H310_12768 [Aphanomyces invadans]|eukprot:XP_008878181.1 hypothetical protein H310_12768 [Aphanomyces invadans]
MALALPTESIAASSAAEMKEYSAAEAHESVFVNCCVVAPPCDENERKRVDVVVVLDRSGSMSREKLDLCKKTLDFLAQQLTANDRVGSPVLVGLETQLTVQSILLLTDSQANEGVTHIVGLSSIVETCLPRHVSLHTFGYGNGHDASLLTKLADRGSYYFVENVDAVMLAFADCLGGLAIMTKRPTTVQNSTAVVQLGDMYADEMRDLVVELARPASDTSVYVVFQVRAVEAMEAA